MAFTTGTVLKLPPLYEWKIPRFFMTTSKYRCIDSPKFVYLHSTCHLRINVKDTNLWVALSMKDSDADTRTITFGIKKADNSLQEKSPIEWRHKEGSVCLKSFLFLAHLQEYKSIMVPADTLTVTCRINTILPPVAEIMSSKNMELETLSWNFGNLFISKKRCDVTISVKGKEFQAHRAVLMARSPVFFAMFEHRMSEEEKGVITIPDCDPHSFEYFLEFLYTGKFKGVSFWNAHHLYVTADKYDVLGLKSFCRADMMQNMTVESVCDVIALADQYDDTELMSLAQIFFNTNFKEVFSTAGWKTLMKTNFNLGNKLLKKIASILDIQK